MLNDLLDRIRAVFIDKAPSLIYAICILLAGLLASKLARSWLRAILERSRIREDRLLKDFFLRVVSVSILLLALLTAFSRVGIDVRTFIAGLGVTGIILGFALRDTLSNFASGVLLLIYRPFRAGDLVEVEGTKGVVEELTIVNMRMTSTAGVPVIMPNSKVWGAKITNYSPSRHRRVEFTLKVAEQDVESAISTIEAALGGDSRIIKEPSAAVHVVSVANGTVRLFAFGWTEPKDYERVNGDGYLRLLSALSQQGIKVL